MMGTTHLLSDRGTRAAIEVPFGYFVSLGNTARRNGHTQAELNEGVVGGIETPTGYDNEGVFEFTVYLPENTNTAFISIPLLKRLSENGGYGPYLVPDLTDENDIEEWGPFDTIGTVINPDGMGLEDLLFGGAVVYADAYYSARGSDDGSGL